MGSGVHVWVARTDAQRGRLVTGGEVITKVVGLKMTFITPLVTKRTSGEMTISTSYAASSGS